jgi:GNAT superfamily N-acetyltransferase
MADVEPVDPGSGNLSPPRAHELPPGYPREYETDLVLRDGRRVFVRPILPGDSAAIARAIRYADPETLYRRFLAERPHITPALLDRLTIVDYVHRLALVAADPLTSTGVAVARYSEVEPGVAEVAVVVDPGWRRLGLATALIGMLGRAGLRCGVRTFTAYHLAENRAVSALCHLVPGGHSRVSDGVCEYRVDLDRALFDAAGTQGPAGRPTTS